MASKTLYVCRNCIYIAHSLKEARAHAKEAGPIWHPGRQTFVTHSLARSTEQDNA